MEEQDASHTGLFSRIMRTRRLAIADSILRCDSIGFGIVTFQRGFVLGQMNICISSDLGFHLDIALDDPLPCLLTNETLYGAGLPHEVT